MSDASQLRFLPSLARRFGGPVTRSAGRLQSELRVRVLKEGGAHATVAKTIVLRGPGDVTTINPSAIARMEPPPGSHDFEPNYFPFVEFVDPDFPWRYSLDPDTTPARRRPWLALLVLSAAELQRLVEEDGLQAIGPVDNGREVLRVTGDLLPDLDQSWALAHVQLTRFGGEAVADLLQSAPERSNARLLCCRKLEPRTRYVALLIPTYQAGAEALKPGEPAATFDFAWGSGTGRDTVFELPIYHRWEFITSEQGDFESLARELAPAPVAGLAVGTRALDAARMRTSPGGAPIHVLREGALSVPGFEGSRQSYADASQPLPLTPRLRASLDASLQSQTDADEGDPLLTFPAYGSHQRKVEVIESPGSDGQWSGPARWLHELNLDFRNRVGAGLGTEVVRQNQHSQVKACWQQVGKLRQVNERLRLSAAGLRLGLTHERKHMTSLDDERFVLLTVPHHAQMTTKDQGLAQSYARAFADAGVVRGVLSQAFKRIAHRAIGIERVRPFAPFHRTCDRLCFRKPRKPVPDALASKVIAELIGVDLEVKSLPQKPEVIPVGPLSIADFRKRIDLKAEMLAALNAIIRFNDGRAIPETLEPIVAGPELDDPMYRPLSKLSLDYLLPGIELLPKNGVTLMEENRRFIESYMAGLNHELINELTWRRFPVNRAATVFRQFWESTATPKRADIEHMVRWRGALGNNPAPGGRANLVLVIKGDLIRRYPGTIVYAMRVSSTRAGRYEYWREAYPDEPPPMEAPVLIEPAFRAQVGNDIQFVGFPLSVDQLRGPSRDGEYYFVLQENQDLPRFGLDVQSTQTRRPELCMGGPTPGPNDLSWSDVAAALRAGYINQFEDALFAGRSAAANSASVAAKTYQQPVRVAIHASHMLNGG